MNEDDILPKHRNVPYSKKNKSHDQQDMWWQYTKQSNNRGRNKTKLVSADLDKTPVCRTDWLATVLVRLAAIN